MAAALRNWFGDGGRPTHSDSTSSNINTDADSCSYSRVRRSNCSTVQDPETNKPIKKCEKTEELLRHCVGKPTEIVERNTEYSEEEVSPSQAYERAVPEHERFSFADEDSPLKFPEHFGNDLSSGLESFFHAAEEMANELIGQFEFHKSEPRREFPGDFQVFTDEHANENLGRRVFRDRFSKIPAQQDEYKKHPDFALYSKHTREV